LGLPLNLILASGSPRRQQLLKEASVNFTIKTKDTKEIYPSTIPPEEVPVYLAKLKAHAFLEEIKDQTILAADTVVIIHGQILGKPGDEDEAIHMLKTLSGNMHEVITGVCILNKNKEIVFKDVSEVYFKKLSDEDIFSYVRKFKPFDKAGAYGIQEWIGLIGIEKINGSYFNVMGLPVHKVVEELRKF
jgi:septum formation protein